MKISIAAQTIELSENDILNATMQLIRIHSGLLNCYIEEGRKIRVRQVTSVEIEREDVGEATLKDIEAFNMIQYLENLKYYV
jgi:hypothetical protein